jgi:glycosyltransferase involved in cell wall biosynthesis
MEIDVKSKKLKEISQPLVSVIIPMHNRFEMTQQTIESVAAQTYRPIEIIVVDDASVTPFQPVLPADIELAGLSIQTIRLEQNGGPGNARETGRKHAKGEFICYLDSDDLWLAEKVESQVKKLQNNPDAGMCYCTSRMINLSTGEEYIRRWSDHSFSKFLPYLFYGRPWKTSSCMWTRKAVNKIGSWLSEWGYEDYEYDCRAGCLEIKIVFVSDVLCICKEGTENRIRDRFSGHRITLNSFIPFLEMANVLENHGKLEVPFLYDRFVCKLVKLRRDLLRYGEKNMAFQCRECIKRLTKLNSPFHLVVHLLFLRKISRFSGFGDSYVSHLRKTYSKSCLMLADYYREGRKYFFVLTSWFKALIIKPRLILKKFRDMPDFAIRVFQ